MVSLTIAYVNLDYNSKDTSISQAILLYRALNKLYHCPLTAGIESISLVYLNSLWYLLFVSFLLDRFIIFYRKSTYVLVSVWTAMKNKK